MKQASSITIVGAGLAGLSTAWALQRRGWQVTVLEGREGPGRGTSFANAGMLTPSMADPWNSPGVWKQLLAWLGREDAPMLLRLSALPDYLGWGLRFLANSSPGRHAAATRSNFALASFSMAEFKSLREELDIGHGLRTKGTMQVFRDPGEFGKARHLAERLQDHGLRARVLDGPGLVAVEPLLAPVAGQLVGAVHFPDDETGDAHRFCVGLARALEARGARFEYGVNVEGLRCERGRLRALRCADGERETGQVVLSAGAWTPALAADAGLRLPIRPVKGYSLTVPVHDAGDLPSLSIIDQHYHAAITPFEDRLRLAGTAEFAGWDARVHPGRIAMLWDMLDRLLPAQRAQHERDAAQSWCGFRPMAADCVPYIGPSAVAGVAVNAGHGHLGWTQSMGSGVLIAQLLTGEAPGIDPAPYRLAR